MQSDRDSLWGKAEKMLHLASAVLLFMFATPATAQSGVSPVAAPKVADASSKDHIRCRRIATTGSLARKERVCKTNAQWASIARAGNDSAPEAIERSQAIHNDR